MTSQEFVVMKLKELTSEFSNIMCRYENDFISNTHFVEVVPRVILESNRDFKRMEKQVMMEFINLFPNQNLCFLSDDALVGLDKIDFEVKGALYDTLYSFNKIFYKVINNYELDLKPSRHSFLSILGQPNNVLSEKIHANFYSKSVGGEEWVAINSIDGIEICKPAEVSCKYIYAIAA